MENNQNTDLQLSQGEQQIESDNLNIENGKEGEGQIGINYEGEYDGEMEGDEENKNQSKQEKEKEKEEIEPEEEQKDQIEDEIEKKQEDKIDRGEEQEMKEENEGSIEMAKEEVPQEVCDVQNEEGYNDNNKKEENENEKENFELNNNDKNINENKKNSLKKRIDILNNKLNLSKEQNSKNKEKVKENENIEDKDNEIDKENNYIFLNLDKRNDNILSELLGEIKEYKNKNQYNNKQFIYNSKISNSNYNLNLLNQEFSKGLEKLNNINYNANNIYKTIEEQKTNYQPKRYIGNIERNQKFNEIFSIVNERDFNVNKKYNNISKIRLLSHMRNKMKYNSLTNINLFAPKRNYYLLNALDNKTIIDNNYRALGNDTRKYYISCIDGKAIVNGMRKDILFTSNLNYKYNNIIKNNLFDDLNDKTNYYYTLKNIGKPKRRINSYFKNNVFDYERRNSFSSTNGKNNMKLKKIKNNSSNKENLIKKLNEMDDNYFKKELKFLK